MSVRERPHTHDDVAIREVERQQRSRFRLPALGLFQAMKVTLRQLLSKAVTVHYPDERIELPPRTRGVIALLEENCTVCMLCAKDCPCWCIYIEGHKVQKPGRRKPVNALDRFAIDYGLCMYCGICVEVCPFDALHWSPFFEYTSYTYEGMIHEAETLTEWEHHVLPPPELVDDADEKAREQTKLAHDKRTEGIWAVIREEDKQEAYLRDHAPQPPMAPPQAAGPIAPTAPPGTHVPSSETPADERPPLAEQQAPASGPSPAPAEAAAPHAPQPSESVTTASEGEGTVETFGLPRIDPLNLPDGIGPVERGRLKKLGVLQERGQEPDPKLVENLRPILDQMEGGG